jgi:hypothetical protein
VQPRAAATALNQQLSTLNAWKTADYRPGVESRRLVSAAVARIIIAEVVADDVIEEKIRDKHPPLTFETVRHNAV